MDMLSLDDNGLLEQLRDHTTRDEAFKTLMDRYGQRLYWHIRRVVVSHEDAEDVFQEACIKAYSGLNSFRGNGEQLLSWLYRIATNESLILLRRRVNIFRSIESLSPQLVNTLRSENPQAAGKAEMLLAEAVLQLPVTRFMKYAMTNLAGYYIGQSRMGTFGYLEPWCLVEDEQACHRVGWATWQEQQGFSANDNTITCASALMWGNNMAPSTIDPEKTMQLLAWDIADRGQFALGSGKQFTNRVVLMTEPVAATLAKGYPTLDILESTLIENSRRPARERAFANYYANPGSRKDDESHTFNQYYSHICKDELAEETYTPEWYDTPQGTIVTVPTMEPGATAFLVTGDASRNKIQTMPGGGFTVEQIELPRNWDALAADLGYEPLSTFFLASDGIVTSAPQPAVTGQQRQQRRYTGTYNVVGQRMNRPQGRGFFIRDGRKYVQ